MTDEVKQKVGRPRIGAGKIRSDGWTEAQWEWMTKEAERRGVSKFVLMREAMDLLIAQSDG
jgi:hypothetical protein